MFTHQKPIGSGFGAATQASDLILGFDLSGKWVLVVDFFHGGKDVAQVF
ncbi:MAG: hypothetical protein H7070_05290 [Saprospiraceae bacterium]|nr:hypothetical protein [Pyrinomonadaceae bacterium]